MLRTPALSRVLQRLPADLQDLLTPALLILTEAVDDNIATMIHCLDEDLDRWQPHIKTFKSRWAIEQLVQAGIRRFKCATTLELATACDAGAAEVLVAYPCDGARGIRVREIAAQYPDVRISAVVENLPQITEWRRSPVSLFIDINPGMNRTGISQDCTDQILELATTTTNSGIELAGLHYYDGHHRQPDLAERTASAYPGYERLLEIAAAIGEIGINVNSLVTSGTPATPCALAFPGFRKCGIPHRVSPGTVLYNDLSTASQLPLEWDFQFAAVVASTVISHPAPGRITCDAGHKAVSSDAGFPNCVVLGHPDLEPLHPSEEHLPIRIPDGHRVPEIGEILYLIPRHICTTVNNFNEMLFVNRGEIVGLGKVDARGRESPAIGGRLSSRYTFA